MPLCSDGPLIGETHEQGPSFEFDGRERGRESGTYLLVEGEYRWQADWLATTETDAETPTRPCPVCGGTNFVVGSIPAVLGSILMFVPTERTRRGADLLVAWKCRACGHVQLFGRPEP